MGTESCKIVLLFSIHLFGQFAVGCIIHPQRMHYVTDRQTDSIMTIADPCAWLYDRLMILLMSGTQ